MATSRGMSFCCQDNRNHHQRQHKNKNSLTFRALTDIMGCRLSQSHCHTSRRRMPTERLKQCTCTSAMPNLWTAKNRHIDSYKATAMTALTQVCKGRTGCEHLNNRMRSSCYSPVCQQTTFSISAAAVHPHGFGLPPKTGACLSCLHTTSLPVSCKAIKHA